MTGWLPPQYAAQIAVNESRAVAEQLNAQVIEALTLRYAVTEQEQTEAHERAISRHLEIVRRHAANLASADPFRSAVLELHGPQFSEVRADTDCYPLCGGCDFGGWEGEPPDWPCRTYTLATGETA